MDISVIIVNHNTKQHVIDCIASLEKTVPPRPYEIIVVDNASSDGSAEAICERFPSVKVIKCSKNLGFGRANNLGAKEAQGEFLFILNSDTLVCPNAVERLASALESNPKAGIASPRIVDADDKDQEVVALLMTPKTVLFSSARKSVRHKIASMVERKEQLAGIAYFCAAAIMVRQAAFKEAGGFDESYFFYCEDPDLSKMIADAGWQMEYVPEAKIIHFIGVSVRCKRIASYIERNRGRCYYMRKHFGIVPELMVGCCQFTNALIQALLNALGVVVTLGLAEHYRRKVVVNGLVALWYILGRPKRESWLYVKLFGSWQKS
ncbi:MAG: glycosyltransferase family 2 protein [Armatimonadota bacterium]